MHIPVTTSETLIPQRAINLMRALHDDAQARRDDATRRATSATRSAALTWRSAPAPAFGTTTWTACCGCAASRSARTASAS